MSISSNPTAPYLPPKVTPVAGSDAKDVEDSGTQAAQQKLAQDLMALMAAIMSTAQSGSTPNTGVVQAAAQKVLTNLPMGATPQWLSSVQELAATGDPSVSQLQSAQSTLLASLNPTGQPTDPQAPNNRYHHPKGPTV
ncbi:MAG TPA: hypothetical protein VK832_11040 [Burkholderiaceae bacterium]|jgi:hypothetical protein|nr:hypothetical protein [Burkholderiaceae bacterium]